MNAITRRMFVGHAAAAAGFAAAASLAGAAHLPAPAPEPGEKFRLGMAGYTFRKFPLDATLKMLQRVDVRFFCIKDFHLPLTCSEADAAAFHETCRAHNVVGYGVGPIYMGDRAAIDQAFDYARRVGANLIVGVPHDTVDKRKVESPELLKYVEEKVRAHDIRFAIHNHGPDNLPYATGRATMEFIGKVDPRIGIGLDIGHNLRAGVCPIEDMERCADRIFDIHLKDVNAADKNGKTVELGRGIIDIPSFVRALRKTGYAGVCSLEFEKDADDPLPGVAESIGYFRGVVRSVRV